MLYEFFEWWGPALFCRWLLPTIEELRWPIWDLVLWWLDWIDELWLYTPDSRPVTLP
jgi:hypothetical protein